MNFIESLLWIIGIILIALAIVVSSYFEFKCGMGAGSLADIPRYCWWFR
jgi:hypothetical protein